MLYPNGSKTQPRVSSPYGPRTGGVSSFHEGVDLIGFDDAKAAAGGTVTSAGWLNNAAGNTIVIQHDGYSTRYMHLDSIAVRKGQIVGEGQYLGRVGSTGNATGKCLHFEVRLNAGFTRTEPLAFVAARLTGAAPAPQPAPSGGDGAQPAGDPGGYNPFGIRWSKGLQKIARLYGYRGALDAQFGGGSMAGFAQFLRVNWGYAGNDELGPIMWASIARWLRARWGYVGNDTPGPVMRAALLRAEAQNYIELPG